MRDWMLEPRDYYYRGCCRTCEDYEIKFENCKQNLKSILQNLYKDPYINVPRLQEDLDNLCDTLEVEIPKGEIILDRGKSTFLSPKDLIDFNNNYLKFLTE